MVVVAVDLLIFHQTMMEKIVVSQLSEALSGYFAGRKDISMDFLFGSVARRIVVLNEAPLALSYRVIRDGILLFSGDRDTYILYR